MNDAREFSMRSYRSIRHVPDAVEYEWPSDALATGLRQRSRRQNRVVKHVAPLVVALAAVVGLPACGGNDERVYDIRPIFPLDPDKCDRYDGRAEGRSCFVTQSQCERAATDWREAMGGVSGAIQFRC